MRTVQSALTRKTINLVLAALLGTSAVVVGGAGAAQAISPPSASAQLPEQPHYCGGDGFFGSYYYDHFRSFSSDGFFYKRYHVYRDFDRNHRFDRRHDFIGDFTYRCGRR